MHLLILYFSMLSSSKNENTILIPNPLPPTNTFLITKISVQNET